MKKVITALAFIGLLAGQTLQANPTIFKAHKNKKGKDDEIVNCAYCHTKAAVQKQKGQDLKALKKGPYCALKDCHM